MYYAVSTLIERFRRDGALEAVEVLYRIFMYKCVRRRSCVFVYNHGVDGDKIMGTISKRNVVIKQISKWRDVSGDEKATLRSQGSYIWPDLEGRVKKGAILWIPREL